MPGRNQTGPEGWGPKTGRGAGRCAGNVIPETTSKNAALGFQHRHGQGGVGKRGNGPGQSRFGGRGLGRGRGTGRQHGPDSRGNRTGFGRGL